jgi:hypothetical protein
MVVSLVSPARSNAPFLIDSLTEYVITMPNMYGRGILFGKMFLELGDKCDAKNVKHDIVCDLEFKTKVRGFNVDISSNS